jgi:hypothetical protein
MFTRLLVLALGSGLPGWSGWIIAGELGVLQGFIVATLCFAGGWYLSRKFVREHLDL